MNKPHFFKTGDFYINLNSIVSVTAYAPCDFESNKTKRDIRAIRRAVGDEITDRYFEWYSQGDGGYHYKYNQEGDKDIFVYKVEFNGGENRIFISPESFEKLARLLEISDID